MAGSLEPLKGVNLGGWLVLERWMTPSLFAGTEARDERVFMEVASAADDIKKHRDTFMTEADFEWLSTHGITAIRLPVGYWILEGDNSFLHGIEYVDWAFDMAEKYGLQVLLSFHGAPGSQNGQDHSGQVGIVGWYDGDNRYNSRYYLRQLVLRYRHHSALWGIGILNEPAAKVWLEHRQLLDWTRETVDILAAMVPENVKIVFGDTFRPDDWTGRIRHPQAVMDVHHYQVFGDANKRLSVPEHEQKALAMGDAIRRWSRDQPVVIGEWSLGLDEKSLQGTNRQEAEDRFLRAQLIAFDAAAGWFFWNYKTENNDGWNFRYLVETGQLSFSHLSKVVD